MDSPVVAPDLLRRRSLGGPAARSLLLTVLGEFVLDHAEPVWNAALVRALEALGIRELTARQAVTPGSCWSAAASASTTSRASPPVGTAAG